MTLGHGLIWFSLAATLAGMLCYVPGLTRVQTGRSLAWARTFVYLSAAGLLGSTAWLWNLILTHQFQYSYVFRYSSLDMPLKYVISSLWGGQEGTFLLWAAYGGLLAVFLRFKARQYESAVNFFYMGITLFLTLMMVKASPFLLLDETPLDGNGLNPLLQDPWMTIHPPIMFLGFASLGIPAAFAMAAMVKKDWDNWIPRTLPWTLLGVLALGTGLTLGGYWSYSILGWGGYWGWDPVENSSLVPWLFAISLLHNQILQLKRGLFRRANLMLALVPFLMLTYSTFLTRSGVLADFSVHSFTDLGINQFLVAFMGTFLLGGLGMYIFRFRQIPVEAARVPIVSREYFMFLGSLIFAFFGVFVLLGTSAPLLTRVWGSVGNVEPEFYNKIGLPFTIFIALAMGVAPHLIWNRPLGVKGLIQRLWPALVAMVAGVLLSLLIGIRFWPYLGMMAGGAFVLASNARIVFGQMRKNVPAAGGYIAHIGLGFMVLGIVTSTTQDRTELVELPRGHAVEALGYTMEYLGSRPVEEGRKNGYDIRVTQENKSWLLSPTMYYSEFNAGMMKKPAIQSLWSHDIYIAPGGESIEPVEDRLKHFIVLHKKQPQVLQGVTFMFDRFETTNMPGEDEAPTSDPMTVYALIDVTVEGQDPMTIKPYVKSLPEGMMEVQPVAIGETGLVATLDGIDATNGVIRVGVAEPPLVVQEGETGSLAGMDIRFDSFDVDMGSMRRTKISVYADVTVFMGQDSLIVKPGMIHRANMDPLYEEAALGQTGLNLVLASVNANTRTAEFYVAPPPQEAIWVEASVKPFIVLLWIGTGLVVIGVAVAAIHRGKLAARMEATLNKSLGVLKGKGTKRAA